MLRPCGTECSGRSKSPTSPEILSRSSGRVRARYWPCCSRVRARWCQLTSWSKASGARSRQLIHWRRCSRRYPVCAGGWARAAGWESAGRGYRLCPGRGEFDAAVFEEQVARARAATEPGQVLGLLDAAESLWRGAAYYRYDNDPGVRMAAERLEQLRNTAREEQAAALLALGRSHEAAEQAASLLRKCPLHERAVEDLGRGVVHGGTNQRGAHGLRGISGPFGR